MRLNEEAECIAFNSYLLLLQPYCDFIYTFSGNGGFRHPKTAATLKRMGLRPGIWDYYFRSSGKPTLWIEMKFDKNGVSRVQGGWRERLEPEGDIFKVCYSAEEGLKALVDEGFVPKEMVVFGPHVCSLRLFRP